MVVAYRNLGILTDQTHYVFPCIGLGSSLSKATSSINNMIYTSLPNIVGSVETAITFLSPLNA